jgi:hypothetical protein
MVNVSLEGRSRKIAPTAPTRPENPVGIDRTADRSIFELADLGALNLFKNNWEVKMSAASTPAADMPCWRDPAKDQWYAFLAA